VPRLDFPFPTAALALFRRCSGGLRGTVDVIPRARSMLMRREQTARLLNPVGTALLKAQVPDTTLRAALTPDFAFGCERLLLSNTYLPALSKPNVELIPHALVAVDEHGSSRPTAPAARST